MVRLGARASRPLARIRGHGAPGSAGVPPASTYDRLGAWASQRAGRPRGQRARAPRRRVNNYRVVSYYSLRQHKPAIVTQEKSEQFIVSCPTVIDRACAVTGVFLRLIASSASEWARYTTTNVPYAVACTRTQTCRARAAHTGRWCGRHVRPCVARPFTGPGAPTAYVLAGTGRSLSHLVTKENTSVSF